MAAYANEQAGHGISQAELARRADVAKATLSKVLRGEVWPDSVTVARFEHLGLRMAVERYFRHVPRTVLPARSGDTDTD